MNGRQWKQKVIDGYLAASGKNQFIPSEFLGWLQDKPEHECHSIFFGMSDEEAAAAYREELVRKWVSGLRVIVRTEQASVRQVGTVEVREFTLPLYHSPTEGRRHGGGYVSTDPNDPLHLAEIARQGAVALAAWMERYSGVAKIIGISVETVDTTRIGLDLAADRLDPPKQIEAA